MAGVAFCEMCWKFTEASHENWFWGNKLSRSWENPWESVDFEATKCENWRKSRTKCSFWGSNMSRLDSLVFSAIAVSIGEAAKPVLESWLWCPFTSQAWRFVTFSCVCKRAENRFVWQAQYFRVDFRRWVAVFVAGARLCRPPSSIYVAGAALQTCRVTYSTLHPLHSTLYTPQFTFHTSHSTLYTLHFTLHTLHSTLHTLRFTIYNLHFTLRTLHFKLHTSHFTLHPPHFTLYTPHSTLYTLHSTLDNLQFALYTLHSTLYTLHSTLHTLHFTLHTLHSTLHTLHSTLHTLHFTLHTQKLHSTL